MTTDQLRAATIPIGERLSKEWIESIGGPVFKFGEFTLSICVDNGRCWSCDIEVENNAAWYGCRHTVSIETPVTKDDVRTLCRALGITLKGGDDE